MPGEKERIKKDKYQRALASYTQAMKDFHKGDYQKASVSLKVFLEKHAAEKEITDRAQIYLKICEKQNKKETIQLKTFDDYYQYGIYKANQGEFKEALALLEKARELKPKEGKIAYLIASVYCRMGEEEPCLENLTKSIHLDKYFKIIARNESDFESLGENKKFNIITKLA